MEERNIWKFSTYKQNHCIKKKSLAGCNNTVEKIKNIISELEGRQGNFANANRREKTDLKSEEFQRCWDNRSKS